MSNNNLTYVPSEKWYPNITRDVKGLVLGQMCAAQMIGWGAIGNHLGVCGALTPYLFMQLVLFPFNGVLLYRLGKGINSFRHRDKSIPAIKAIKMARRRAKAEHKMWKKRRSEEKNADSVVKELEPCDSFDRISDPFIRKVFGLSNQEESEDIGASVREYFGISQLPDEFYHQRGVNISAYAGYTNNHYRTGRDMWNEEESDWDGDYAGGTSTQGLTPPRTPRPSPRTVWDDACRRFAAVSEKLTAYETDIEAVYFTKPLLRDVTERATAAFYDAFGEAQLLLHDTFDADRDDAEELFRAVTKAERAWDAANANAQRKAAQNIVIGGRSLSEDQVRELNTAKRALARVLDPASSPAEAAKAWNLVQTTVDALRLRPSESLDAKLVFALPSALRELPA